MKQEDHRRIYKEIETIFGELPIRHPWSDSPYRLDPDFEEGEDSGLSRSLRLDLEGFVRILREFREDRVYERTYLQVLTNTNALLREWGSLSDGKKAQGICRLYYQILELGFIRQPRELPWGILLIEHLRCRARAG